jgi:histidinol-phosphate aminotransferase
MIIDNLVNEHIKNLTPYSSARNEFKGVGSVFLDANENPFGEFNRYPDPLQLTIKKEIAEFENISIDNIFLGNGSDEAIDLVFRVFCNSQKDYALVFTPTYGMYSVCAAINNIPLIELPLKKNFQIDIKKCKQTIEDRKIKLLFICSPNNPTANNINAKDILFILKKFKGIVVVDEAYIDFSEQPSLISYIKKYPNLIVLRTFSKAWGLAAARVGMAISSKEVITYFNKVKPPYNISLPNQQIVLKALKQKKQVQKTINQILKQRSIVIKKLQQLSIVNKIYSSQANFILVKVTDAIKIYNQLVQKQLIIRNRTTIIKNCLRITIGTAAENKLLIKALKEIENA